jgi:potassium/hydrogen antiporter
MQWHNETLLIGALLLTMAVALGGLSSRMGVPFLLVFLVVGMAGGEDGPGGIDFDDFSLSFLIGNLALAVILLDGGLRTRLLTFRVGLRPALVLASAGVAVTAGATGLFAAWALDIDWRTGLLLGAIVASTDAAAVFSLLKSSGLRLNDRVGATLEIESGVNDPMAIFLTLTLIAVVQTASVPGPGALALEFLRQFGVGAAAGVAGGWAMAATARWWAVGEGLAAILVGAVGVGVFALTNLLGGSGFLAVYLFGLVAGHRASAGHGEMLRAMDGLAWLAQAGLFLLLGLLVTPSELPQLLGAALAISVFLIAVARPLAVFACLAPFRFARAETAYVSWVGLRGAVPIVLALFPLLAGVPDAKLLFNVAFVVVLVSLLIQGTTVAWAARRLRVELPQRDGPVAEHALAGGRVLAEFRIAAGAPACGLSPSALPLPAGCAVAQVAPAGGPVDAPGAATPFQGAVRVDATDATDATDDADRRATDPAAPSRVRASPERRLAPGDVVALIGNPRAIARCGAMFAATGTAVGRGAPMTLQMSAEARWGEVRVLYGLPSSPATGDASPLWAALESLAGRPLVEGDRIAVGHSAFVVVEVDAGRAARIAFEPRAQAPVAARPRPAGRQF